MRILRRTRLSLPTVLWMISRSKKLLLRISIVLVLVLLIWTSARAVLRAEPHPEQVPLHRDLYGQEEWTKVNRDHKVTPDLIPGTVHYVWCGSKQFRFQHYLGLLSVIRLLQPMKIVFHYTHLPDVDSDWYNLWFQELKQSYGNLHQVRMDTSATCGSRQLLTTILGYLRKDGGIYVGENVILTQFPNEAALQQHPFWHAFADAPVNTSQGVIFARRGFRTAKVEEHLHSILGSKNRCGGVEEYNRLGTSSGPPCVLLTADIHPKDVWDTLTPFAELARWLLYGKREVQRVMPVSPLQQAQQNPATAIPRVSHLLWMNKDGSKDRTEFMFAHFLSVLSALHVAGLRHVYVHGDHEPRGEWWEKLRGENVTFVPLDVPQYVFQQWVSTPTHRSDIIRLHILLAYGGVYQDQDILWVTPLPDWLLQYPTVVCPDWPDNGEWPDTFNIGVLMSRALAPWLRYLLATLRLFLNDSWAFNAIFMPYRVYEWHPDTLYVDRHLQVICRTGTCHPTWRPDYKQQHPASSRDFNWREARALHFLYPKPPDIPSLSSPQGVRHGTDMMAEVGREILQKSGRRELIGGT